GDAHHLRPWRTLEAREPPAAGDLGDPAAHGLDRRLGELRPAPRPLAGRTPVAPVRRPLHRDGRAAREGAAPGGARAALRLLWELLPVQRRRRADGRALLEAALRPRRRAREPAHAARRTPAHLPRRGAARAPLRALRRRPRRARPAAAWDDRRHPGGRGRGGGRALPPPRAA